MAVIAEDDSRLKFVPLDVAAVPPSGFIEHRKDWWWCVHPAKGLVIWSEPKIGIEAMQGNSNRSVADHFKATMYPWAEVQQIPSVFKRIDPRDYA